jgi:hypothetical protein
LSQLIDDMHRETNGFRLIAQCAPYGLLDPPRAVSRELGALRRVITFHRLDQPDIPFADQVQQRHAVTFVIAGDLHDQAQVGLDHLLAGFLIAFTYAFGQMQFLFGTQQFGLSDLLQIKPVSALFLAAALCWLLSARRGGGLRGG